MKKRIKISVIIPVYNSFKYLDRLMKSLIDQSFKEYELIFVNDGSTDNSLCKLEEYKNKYDFIKVIDKKNEGVSIARNTGLKNSLGDYILFIDADDYVEHNMLNDLYLCIEKYDADVVCTGYYYTRGSKHVIHFCPEKNYCFNQEEAIKELIKNQIIGMSACAKLYKKSVLKNIKFNEKYKHFEDRLFVFDAFRKSNKVIVIPKVYYHYCMNEDSTCHAKFNINKYNGLKVMDYMYGIVNKFYPHLEIYSYVDVIVQKYYILNLMIMENADKIFKNEYLELIYQLKKINYKKIKGNVKKSIYYQLLLLKISKSLYKVLKKRYLIIRGNINE